MIGPPFSGLTYSRIMSSKGLAFSSGSAISADGGTRSFTSCASSTVVSGSVEKIVGQPTST